MATLNLQHIDKIYDNNVQAVFDFNLDVKDGELIVLVGPSGCGKSTTLRMVAGLEDISNGKLLLDGKDITATPAKDRDMAMVFQSYALYGHMTIYENMAFSLTLRKENPNVIHKKVLAAAEILGLTSQLNKKPAQLSGGQRQRVAMGRSIVRNPKVFLFDEPLSNLDAKLRGATRREILLLHKRLQATMLYVTHDQTEALTLADRIVCMSMGHVQQVGTPLELYDSPANVFVASFIGLPPMNFYDVRVNGDKLVGEGFQVPLTDEEKDRLKAYQNKEIILGVRPENIVLGNDVPVTVSDNENLGMNTLVHGRIGSVKGAGGKISAKLKGWQDYKNGDAVSFTFDRKHFFDKETTTAIQRGGLMMEKKKNGGLKEVWRKFLVSIKRRPQMIPLAALVIAFLFYSLNLMYVSDTTARIQGPGMGLAGFATMLFSMLSFMCFMNAFPYRKKPNIPMVVLMFVMLGVVIFSDVYYMSAILNAVNRADNPISITDSTMYILSAYNNLNIHIIILVVAIVLVLLLPVYSKLLRKIKTSIDVGDNGNMDAIDISGEA